MSRAKLLMAVTALLLPGTVGRAEESELGTAKPAEPNAAATTPDTGTAKPPFVDPATAAPEGCATPAPECCAEPRKCCLARLVRWLTYCREGCRGCCPERVPNYVPPLYYFFICDDCGCGHAACGCGCGH